MSAGRLIFVGTVALALAGCKDDPAAAAGDDAADTHGTTGAADDGPAPTTAVTTTGASASGASGTPTSDDGPIDTSADTGSQLCGITDDDDVWFELKRSGSAVGEDNVDLGVQCGGQGSFMFQFDVDIYGVDTLGEEWVDFEVTMDVEGFNEDGGHFLSRPVAIYVGCEDVLGGINPALMSLVLPDFVLEPSSLDGATFGLNVVMLPGSPDEYTFTTSGTVTAVSSGDWDWCFASSETGADTSSNETGSTGGSDSGSTTG